LTRKFPFSLVALLFLIVSSCQTYFIPIESFKKQFEGIDSTKLKEVTVQGTGFFGNSTYLANPIKVINCVDKNNRAKQLTNSPSIEMRITYGFKNKRTVFYFDRVFISQQLVVGVQSRFIDVIRKTVPLDSITKIEIQDGHKNLTYIDN
jgi:hypothetical protein